MSMDAVPASIVHNVRRIENTASKILKSGFILIFKIQQCQLSGGLGKYFPEDARAFNYVGLLNPRRWRGKRIHHGVGLCVVCRLEKGETEEKVVRVAFVVGFMVKMELIM